MDKIDFVNATQPALNDTNLNLMQDNIERAINAQVSGDTLPIGTLLPFTSTTTPANWLLCDGRAISRTTYSQLYNVIGTRYGTGDGSTTFNLPDLRGRVPVGYDSTQTEFNSTGKTGGEKTHTLTTSEMPSHTHTFHANLSFTGSGSDGSGLKQGSDSRPSSSIDSTGGGNAHNNLQPYIVTRYIIKAFQTAGTVASVVNAYNTSTANIYSASYVNGLNAYSTTERRVGTWINGKPLYEKTVTGTKVSGTDLELDILSSGVANTIFIAGGYLESTSGIIYPLTRNEGDVKTFCQISSDKTQFKFVSSTGNYTNGTVLAVIRYTKTTD